MSSQGRIDTMTATINAQSQKKRTQPYSLSTPRGGTTGTGSSSAPRSEQRSIRGIGASKTGDDNHDTSDANTDRILAAIVTLSTKINQDILVLSDNLHQEIADFTEKVDQDIATLSNKTDEDVTSIANKIDLQFNTVSNKVNQLIETFEQNWSHQAGGPAPAQTNPGCTLPSLKQVDHMISPQAIRNIPGTWATDQLPPIVNGAQNVKAAQLYTTLVKTAGKHARERLHILVLHNIKNNPEATVPCIKRLLHRLANYCGDGTQDLDFSAYWPTTPLALRLRIAYIRREAVRIFQSLQSGGGGGNIWSRVNKQLHKLRVEGPLYTSAFYRLVYNQDTEWFDGTGFFSDFNPEFDFALPSEDKIREEMERLEEAGEDMEE
ncbi:uncharacterized protein MELLADRAFT_89208 [Melampsora larici-populina 98AG31]|uniref:Uncharacterized protein n=1 Tax=Melampsora larici-populina (strain 98AG31 / pathotype 3-4-7) TaxID=747676 RepID=F4R5B8_MELLP|nr:uncharacterized protein MELLADRAFT_89208 [Melampsora larici-populina 98AG31]EGG12019.1 hypothetical protein MELLADRAFT_89208 [Melampsora larici-populina 98AG31]